LNDSMTAIKEGLVVKKLILWTVCHLAI